MGLFHPSSNLQALQRPPGGGKAGIVYSEAPRFAGMLRPREYVTCDAEAPTERVFVCKSCLVPEGPRAQAQKGHVRANLLFAMRVKERKGTCASSQLQVSRRPRAVTTMSLSASGMVQMLPEGPACLAGSPQVELPHAMHSLHLSWLTEDGELAGLGRQHCARVDRQPRHRALVRIWHYSF